MPGPQVIYGGPYAHESEAIITEGSKKKPNFDKLIAGWKTITQGAMDAIELQKNPPEAFAGNFSKNHEVSEEEKKNPEVPPVIPYTTPDEEIVEQGIGLKADVDDPTKVVTAPQEAIDKLIDEPNDPDKAAVNPTDRDNIEQKNDEIDAKKAEENQAKDSSSGSTSETKPETTDSEESTDSAPKPSDVSTSEAVKSGDVKSTNILDSL